MQAAFVNDAIWPSLLQTTGNMPVLTHTGPFGNVASGSSSGIADQISDLPVYARQSGIRNRPRANGNLVIRIPYDSLRDHLRGLHDWRRLSRARAYRLAGKVGSKRLLERPGGTR